MKNIIASIVGFAAVAIYLGCVTSAPDNDGVGGDPNRHYAEAGAIMSCSDMFKQTFPGTPLREDDDWLKTDQGLDYTRLLDCACIDNNQACSDPSQQFNGQDLTLASACNARFINKSLVDACSNNIKLGQCIGEISACLAN